MRKITTICSALALGGFCLTALAASEGGFPEPSVTPVDGSTLYGYGSTDLEWYEPISIVGNKEYVNVQVSYNGGTPMDLPCEIISSGTVDQATGEFTPLPPYTLGIDWNNLTIDEATWQTNTGKYTITVPAGVLENASGDLNPKYEYTYELYAVRGGETITPDPFAMDEETWEPVAYTAAQLANVVVEFPFSITAVTPALPIACYQQGEDGDGPGGGVMPLSAEAPNGLLDPSMVKVQGNSIILNLSELTEGTWVIEIPKGYAKVNDTTYTNSVEITYVVKYPVAYTLDPESGETVSDLSSITVTFDGEVGFVESPRGNEIILENITTGDTYAGEAVKNTRSTNGSEFTITFKEMNGEEEVPVTGVGEYTLRLYGFYLDGEDDEQEPLPVINAEYTIPYPVEYKLNPSNGSVVESIETITVTFDGVVGFVENPRGNEIMLENMTTGEIYAGAAMKNTNSTNGSEFAITFTEMNGDEEVEITAVGDYVLKLYGFYVDGEDDEQVVLPVITANYTVPYPVAYTINPPANSTVESLSSITLIFDDATVGFVESGRGNEIILENVTTNEIYAGSAVRNTNSTDGSEWEITFTELNGTEEVEITAIGDYVLRIYGFYTPGATEGEVNTLPAIVANYNIPYPVAYTITPEAGSSVESLSTISINFDEAVGFVETPRGNEIMLENTTTGAIYAGVASKDTMAETEGSVWNITFTEMNGSDEVDVTEVGEYVLRLSGFYTSVMDDEENEEMTALPLMIVNYTIPYPVAYTLSPADGSNVESISVVTINFDQPVGFVENPRGNEILLVNDETGDTYAGVPARNTSAETEGSEWNITFTDLNGEEDVDITAVGNYTLRLYGFYTSTVNEDTQIESDPEVLPLLTAHYTIPYPVAYTLNPVAGSSVESLSTVTISFEEAVGFVESPRGNEIILENVDTEELYAGVAVRNTNAETEGSEWNITFTELNGEEEVDITTPGKYTLKLYGFYVDGEDDEQVALPALTVNYEVVYPVAYTLDPASGSNLEVLESVTVTFESSVGFVESPRGNEIILTNETTGTTYSGVAMKDTMAETEGSVWNITFTELNGEEEVTIAEVGEYTLRLYGFYTSYIDEDGEETEGEALPAITANYSIVYPVEYTLDPADGSKVESITEITVTFEGTVGFVEEPRGNEIMLTNNTTDEVYVGTPMKNTNAEGVSEWTITFTELNGEEEVTINTEGEYTLRLYGFYTNYVDEDGEVTEPVALPALIASYTIEYPIEYTLTPENGAEVEEITSVVLTFVGNPNVGIGEVRNSPVVLENLTTGDLWYCENPMKARLEDGSSEFTITFAELGSSIDETITTEGEYMLTVMGIYTSTYDEETDEESEPVDLPNIVAKFYVVNGTTGIENIIDASVYNVYGINGIQVIRNGKASDLNSLNPGLYIINGKKVIIRK